MTTGLDAQKAFSGTVAPEGADVLDEAKLTAWMEAHVEGFEGPLTQSTFAGGQSNPTYKISSPSGNYVLRRKPFGPLLPSAHAVDREYKVQAGLHKTGFPVARQYGLCTDDSVIGSWFYVMGMVDGQTIWDGSMPGSTPENRRATYFAMIDTLAALHNVDVEAAGLSDYGKPGNYFERQVGRWGKQYAASRTDDLPDLERAIAFLARTIKPQERTSIVHGDYRIDNMIFAAAKPRVLAVLDWELSTTGDPLADLSYLLMNWVTEPEGRSGVRGLDFERLGIPTMQAMAERYCAATGRDSMPDLNWYFAFGLMRLAVIVQGIKKRVIDGNASSAHAAEMAEKVPSLAAASWQFAQAAGA